MKAWTLNQPSPVSEHPLIMAEMPVPTASADELQLQVAACAICRTDLHVVEGELPVRRSPLIPGHQIVGRVAALGLGVEGFAIGDRVGVAWLNRTCGVCDFCTSGQENLCEQAVRDGLSTAAMRNMRSRSPLSPTAYRIPLTTFRPHHCSAPA
jgi:alcohol dehydrogenase, propanol-preferring